MLQFECGNAGSFFTIDDGPVNRRCTTELGQKRSMYINGAQHWHIPYQFRQHSEGNDYL